MKADDAGMWAFEPDATDDCEVLCHECDEWSPLAEWTEGEVGCEDCGSHSAIVCPRCDEAYDHVWSGYEPLKTRKFVMTHVSVDDNGDVSLGGYRD